jgi:hypothetical protein
MNSIIDQQQEFRYDGIVLDQVWVRKRIAEQCAYCVEVWASNRTAERKQELVDSALGIMHNWLKMYPELTWLCVALVGGMLVQMAAINQQPKPLPNYINGGVVAVLGEGKEVVQHSVAIAYNKADLHGDIHAPGCFKIAKMLN